MAILVVDDSATLRMQVGRALRTAGFDVLEAGDGKTALEMVHGHKEITCVICDVNMPWMSGIEFVEAIAPMDDRPPVVMLTTEARPEMIERAMAAGASG